MTIVELARERACLQADRLAFAFLPRGEEVGAELSYGGLAARFEAVARGLAHRRGERVLLLHPPGLAFIEAFLGCLAAGVVAVPLELPQGEAARERVRAIAADCGASAVLTTGAAAGLADVGLPVLLTEGLEGDGVPEPQELAFLQYTSGSTGQAKGVCLTHANVMGNQAAIREAARQGARSVFLTWLPLFHDMGLMGMVCQPIFVGAPCYLMPPRAFLQRPRRWLQAISRYKATISGGPNFAFEHCLAHVQDLDGLELSSWEVAYNGAEPVVAETLERFAAAFGPAGLRREALYPCYGLAEATAFLTGAHLGNAGTPVSCGRPYAGHAVSIDAPEGEVGEVLVTGASVASGYYGREPWGRTLRTGDLGFMRDGELYLCGRLKDVLIVRGVNHYPQDLERTARASHPALAHGDAAAVQTAEGVALVVEVRPQAAGEEVALAVRRAIATHHGVAVHTVAQIKLGSLPKTTSGKVRRSACAEALQAGRLEML